MEEANFIKKLYKGSGKYKGKLPFKIFNCGNIGHFQAKFPYPKEDSEDEDDKNKQYRKRKNYTIIKSTKEKIISTQKKKTTIHLRLVTMKSFFLGIEESNEIEEIEHKEESKDEAEVNMEEELLNALDGLRKYKNKYRPLKILTIEQKEKHEHKEKETEKITRNLKN